MQTSKVDLRRRYLKIRRALDPRKREESNRRILKLIRSLPEFVKAKRVLLYCPVKGEPDITPLFGEVLKRGSKLALPKVTGDDLELLYIDTPLCLEEGAYGIPEPYAGERAYPGEIDFIAVPGIAFDKEGYRIGFGKGYYDKLLKRVSAPKVGVAYSFQVLDRVPRENWDEPVDMIVTEEGVIRRL